MAQRPKPRREPRGAAEPATLADEAGVAAERVAEPRPTLDEARTPGVKPAGPEAPEVPDKTDMGAVGDDGQVFGG